MTNSRRTFLVTLFAVCAIGAISAQSSRPAPSSAPGAQSMTPTISLSEVDSLHVLSDPAIIIVPGKFTPSDMQQYLVASGPTGQQYISEISILLFHHGKYDHEVTIRGGMGSFLAPRFVKQFENHYVKLGTRHGPYYVSDFVGNGLDQIFMWQDYGLGEGFVVFGFNGKRIRDLLAVDLDYGYAYPVHTPEKGELKFFPWKDQVEALKGTSEYRYRSRYRFVTYKWNQETWRYDQVGNGEQLVWADPKTRLAYRIP